jgi:hypothetical protein
MIVFSPDILFDFAIMRISWNGGAESDYSLQRYKLFHMKFFFQKIALLISCPRSLEYPLKKASQPGNRRKYRIFQNQARHFNQTIFLSLHPSDGSQEIIFLELPGYCVNNYGET